MSRLDDPHSSYNDELKRLYDRFKEESVQPDAYFDEDDLIEIFDYASDMADDATRIDVLLVGARLYPSSEPLMQRKACLVFDTSGDESARRAVAPVAGSVIGRLLALRIDKPSRQQARERLESIIDGGSDFEDEWIIQLVQTASEIGEFAWLVESKERIMRLTDYPQTFLYEMVEVAKVNYDYGVAMTCAEQLTDLEPFNCEFWENLAEIQIAASKFDDSINSADYALAINPESVRAMMLKAQALYEMCRPCEEVVAWLDKAMEVEPDDPAPAHYKALTLYAAGFVPMAVDALEAYRRRHPDDLPTVEYLNTITDGAIPVDVMMAAMERAAEGNDDWNAKAEELIRAGRHGAAVNMLVSSFRLHQLPPVSALFIELYVCRRYKELQDYMDISAIAGWNLRLPEQLAYTLSLLRIGAEPQKVLESIARTESLLDIGSDDERSLNASPLETAGYRAVTAQIRRSLLSGEQVDIDAIDPFPVMK